MKRERVRLPDEGSADKARGVGEDSNLHLFGSGFEEKPIWAGLYESFRDAVFAAKLPPLELTSMPIPTPDRMAAKTNPWAIGTATLANGGVLAMILLMGLGSTINHLPKSPAGESIDLKDLTIFAPERVPAAGGNGGGSNELTDPMVGRMPRQEEMPIAPAQVPVLENPTLAVDPAVAVEVKLPDDPSLPNIGVQRSANVSLASNGPGTGAGIGTGWDGGVGPGRGTGGYGPGFGDSIYRPGIGGVSKPIAIRTPEAEFSDEARRNKYQGVCVVSIIVDARGYPRNPRVVQSLGMGLDEKALEAVAGYRFKPAMKDGRPVAVTMNVAVNFRLF